MEGRRRCKTIGETMDAEGKAGDEACDGGGEEARMVEFDFVEAPMSRGFVSTHTRLPHTARRRIRAQR